MFRFKPVNIATRAQDISNMSYNVDATYKQKHRDMILDMTAIIGKTTFNALYLEADEGTFSKQLVERFPNVTAHVPKYHAKNLLDNLSLQEKRHVFPLGCDVIDFCRTLGLPRYSLIWYDLCGCCFMEHVRAIECLMRNGNFDHTCVFAATFCAKRDGSFHHGEELGRVDLFMTYFTRMCAQYGHVMLDTEVWNENGMWTFVCLLKTGFGKVKNALAFSDKFRQAQGYDPLPELQPFRPLGFRSENGKVHIERCKAVAACQARGCDDFHSAEIDKNADLCSFCFPLVEFETPGTHFIVQGYRVGTEYMSAKTGKFYRAVRSWPKATYFRRGRPAAPQTFEVNEKCVYEHCPGRWNVGVITEEHGDTCIVASRIIETAYLKKYVTL